MKILVRNLNRTTTETQLHELFKPFGEIASCVLVMDEQSGQSKGFGFIEMPSKEDAKRAISKLNGRQFHGFAIRVKITNSVHRN